MEKLVFADGDKIGVFDGERVTLYESEYITRYRSYVENKNRKDEWKYTGEGARFRGDYERFDARRREKVYAFINGVQWDGDAVLYSFTVNESSGVYRKHLSPKDEQGNLPKEDHVLTSSDEEILSVHAVGQTLAVTVKHGFTSSVGLLNAANAELKTLTDGDVRDANAFLTADKANIYFDSAGAGMDGEGGYTGKFSPSAICSLNLNTMEITEVLRDDKKCYFKPRISPDGALYCIERPAKEKKSGNIFKDILLFPVRILQAFAMFLQAFVMLFTGKSLTSETSEGANPARGRKDKAYRIYIDGNMIEAEKELKRNKKSKDKDYGFIPLSWKLIKIENGGAQPVKSGVCDFSFTHDGGIYCTNGRHIFYIQDGKTKKVADTDSCLTLAAPSQQEKPSDDLFTV